VFLGHAAASLAKFQVPEAEQREVVCSRRNGVAAATVQLKALIAAPEFPHGAPQRAFLDNVPPRLLN
jgi:hypothetical protein